MNRLFILCGLPFAGKSSVAQALQQRFGLTVIAIDAINDECGVGINAAPISAQDWDETYAESYRRLDAALAAGVTVVFDAPGYTRAQRNDLRRIAARHEAQVSVIYLDVPVSVCRERWLNNRQTGARCDVRDEDFEEVIVHFEPPTEDEQMLCYDQSQPLAAWIGCVFG